MGRLRTLTISAALLLGGCAADYEARLASWIGRDVDQLVSQWGTPSGSHIFADGRQVVTYRRGGAVQTPGAWQQVRTPYGWGMVEQPGIVINNWCETTFTVDAQRKITRWEWRGNACG